MSSSGGRILLATIFGLVFVHTAEGAVVQAGTTVSVSGAMRQLVCRGKPGISLRVFKDPSASDPSRKYVTMVLEYTAAHAPPGSEYQGLLPGECSWNPYGWPNQPKEPGRVYFDLLRESQPWSQLETRSMDTTIKAGAYFPDPISLPRYLSEARHYYSFYVDDVTHVSGSFGAYRETAQPTYVTVSGPIGAALSPDTRKEIRCRGGASGLTFTRGGSAGTNLVNVTLAYRVSTNPPGATGRGLDPGTCAWVDRKGLPREPGRVDFTTAGNAQLKQTQSGSTVDRTPTAAERYPDANTIPVYLGDATRFWTFTVTVGSPNTAKAHAAWKPDLADIVTSQGPVGQPTTRTDPNADRFAKRRTEDTSSTMSGSRPGLIFREVVRKPNEYWIRFSAEAGVKPTVAYGLKPPVTDPRTGLLGFPGTQTGLVVRVVETRGFAAEYATAPMTSLAKGTKHYFVINIPATQNRPAQHYTGEFMTLSQTVIVRFTSVQILNDSDKGGAGDLSFRFNVALAPEYNANICPKCVQQFAGRSWETGSTHSLANTFQFKNATDRLRLWVTGWDVDTSDPFWIQNAPAGGARYTGTGGSTSDADWNLVRGEFDLGVNPNAAQVRIPFRLRSVDGFVFMFELFGEIEITRQ